MSLLDDYRMNEDERARRRRFLDIDDADAERVRSLRAIFAEYAEEFAERFYQHLRAESHTASLLEDPQQLERLKKIQAEYFARLLEGVFDAEYFESRLRVGQTHQRIGLSPVWYLGAYNQYVQLSFPLFARALGDLAPETLAKLLSLMKVIFLDIGLALDTYFHDATQQLRQRNVELQQALTLYWQTQRREEQLRRLASHEIRNGLAAVITMVEDIQDAAGQRLAADERGQLQSVVQRCWSLSTLLKEMLAPVEAGGPSWVDTAPIFEALRNRFGQYAQGRAIELVLPDQPPRVWADPIQLREVLANLVSNAVRYLDKEPGKIDISYRPAGEFYEFCVADNGPGIPEAWHERIFEPFVRGPAAGRDQAGTGLGLSFVRSVIEQGGGRVWLASQHGLGSRFFFTVRRNAPATRDTRSSTP